MPASTNIPILATTTDYVAAVNAAIAVTGNSFETVGANLSTYLTAPLALASGAAFKAYADIDGMNKGLKVVTGSAEGATE